MILQLDIGNTRVKWRLRQSGATLQRGVAARAQMTELPQALELESTPAQVWVSSVAGAEPERELASACRQAWSIEPWFARTAEQLLGLSNSYAEPARMGVDRWLAMLAAWSDSRASCCVIDAGSALTIDFISAQGRHLGGYIIPGLDSMERALLSDTDRVRFGEAARDQLDPGCSTEEAVYNGLLLSQAGAVHLALHRMGAMEPTGVERLYFSGGNGEQLKDLLERDGRYVEDLVLDGLQLQGELEAVHAQGQP